MQTDIAARLAEIKERESQASKGPWIYDSYNTIIDGERRCILQITDHPSEGEFGNDDAGIKERSAWYAESASNAVFAASARQDIPWLIEQIEAARERRFDDCMAAKKSGYDDGIAFGIAERDRLTEKNNTLRGAMAAQDEREVNAGIRCGVSRVLAGCDWPDAAADRVIELAEENRKLAKALVEFWKGKE